MDIASDSGLTIAKYQKRPLISPPDALLDRVRWVLLGGVLLMLSAAAPVGLARIVDQLDRQLLVAAVLIILSVWLIVGYRRGGLPRWGMPGEAAGFLLAAGLTGDSGWVFPSFQVASAFRAFFATRADLIALAIIYPVIFFGGVVLLNLEPPLEVLRLAIPFPIVVVVCTFVYRAIARYEAVSDSLRQAHDELERRIEERTAALMREIADREGIDASLRRSEERYRILFEKNPTMYFTIDPAGTVLAVNQFGAEQLGYEVSELIGQSVLAVFPPAMHPAVLRQLNDCLEQPNEVFHWELQKIRKDGVLIWVKESGRAVANNDGQTVVFIVCEDITEQKNLETQLQQAQKMEAVGRLAGGIAHDFNNLLTGINGYSQLLRERLNHSPELAGYAAEIGKAGEQAAAMTGQLLAFGRRQILQPRVIDLNQIVGGMENMLRRLIGEDIDLVTRADPELRTTRADPNQIQQVLLNLAVNARDAMPEGGQLTIETRNVTLDESYTRQHVGVRPGEYVLLAVSDNGQGMNHTTLTHIFEPFFTTKEQGKGTGLGLATVYGIVQQSGGHLAVYSEPGHGATFKIYLPPAEELPNPSQTIEDSQPQTGAETILLVEDEPVVRALVREVLRKQGYRVLVAERPDQAIQLVAEHPERIHLLLTDVVMPVMNGRQLAEQLTAVRPDLLVLYMSGYADQAIIHRGVLDPGSAFISKPFSPDALARKVRELLGDGVD